VDWSRCGRRTGDGPRPGEWLLLPVALAATVAYAWYLSGHFASFLPALRWAVLAAGAAGVAALVAVRLPRPSGRLGAARARLAVIGLVVAGGAAVATPAAWAASTVDPQYAGTPIGPAAGPAGDGFGPGRIGTARRPQGGASAERYYRYYGQVPPSRRGAPGNAPGGSGSGARATPGGGPGGAGPAPNTFNAGAQPSAQTRRLAAYLRQHAGSAKYQVATQGSMSAGELILAGLSVLPMGGFSGQVPFPTQATLTSLA
jgi:hypothetical protein